MLFRSINHRQDPSRRPRKALEYICFIRLFPSEGRKRG